MRLVLNLRTEQEQWYGDDVPPERAVRIAWLMEQGRVMDMHDEARIEAVSVQRGRWSVCCGDWSTLLEAGAMERLLWGLEYPAGEREEG